MTTNLANLINIGLRLLCYLTAGFPFLSYASAFSCHAALTNKASTLAREITAPKSWDLLPDSSNGNQLTYDLTKAILSHPLATRLQAKYGDGSDAIFFLDRPNVGWGLGEERQSAFVAAVLKLIFPEASILSIYKDSSLSRSIIKSDYPSKKVYSLLVQDSAEQGGNVDSRENYLGEGLLQMSLIKPVNPGPALKDKAELRNQMNLPVAAEVIALSGAHYQDPSFAIEALMFNARNRIVIVSWPRTFNIDLSTMRRSLESNRNEVGVYSSSEWPSIQPVPGANYVIFNETKNRLPTIYRASDYAVILGVANLFEPLYQQRPVFFFDDPSQRANVAYNRTAWDQMRTVAISTGAAHVLGNDLSDAHEKLRELLPRQMPHAFHPAWPYEIKDRNGETPLDRFMNNLQEGLSVAQAKL